ncbi:MAG: MFS transporter, partial [Clostridiales Family XIII bacterium]|nr:MFS transporter [Clostridiales Family XIII bacterium]
MMDSGEKKQLSIRRTTLIVVLITSFMMPFSMTALNIAVPIIGKEFHSSAIMLGWVISSFMFCTAVLAVPFGRIADIKGRRGILILGILIFAVGSALSIFSTSMPLLIAFRGVQGVGGAMIFATNIAML